VEFAENILALRSQFKADVIVTTSVTSTSRCTPTAWFSRRLSTGGESGAAYFSSAGNNGLEAF